MKREKTYLRFCRFNAFFALSSLFFFLRFKLLILLHFSHFSSISSLVLSIAKKWASVFSADITLKIKFIKYILG